MLKHVNELNQLKSRAMSIYERAELLPLFYHNLKNAYISNDPTTLTLYRDALSKSLRSIPADEIGKRLNRHQRDDILNILRSAKNGTYYYDFFKADVSEPNDNIFDSDPSKWADSERALEDMIVTECMPQLNQLLGTEMKIIDRQYKTKHGSIDIICKDARSVYILELKRDVANHKIVGQLMKYAIHFQKRLIYNIWDNVGAICIAGNYDSFTYNELKKLNVRTISYSITDGKLKLMLV